MKKLNRRTRVVILSVVLALLFVAIYAAGILLPDELVEPSFMETKLPPSFQHLFGTDALGRDLFFRRLLEKSAGVGVVGERTALFFDGVQSHGVFPFHL